MCIYHTCLHTYHTCLHTHVHIHVHILTHTHFILFTAICPTCGQFLVTLSKVYELQERVAQLQTMMNNIQNDTDTPAPCNNKPGTSCLIDDTTQADKTFVRNGAGEICFCDVSVIK